MKDKIRYIFSNNKNITTGNIPKNIIALALPLMIGALLHSMQSLIDMFWVGRLGPDSISAVAMSSTVMMFLFTISLGIGIGTLSLVAKNIGSQNRDAAGVVASQSVLLSLFLGLIAGIVGFYFSGKFLVWLGASEAVVSVGSNYLRILLLGSITMLVLFTGNYILQGSGDVVHPMIFLGLANIFNIILDPIFIFGLGVPRMGVSGAALATILSQAAAMFMMLRLLNRKEANVTIAYSRYSIRPNIIKKILKIGIPSSLQMFFRTTMYMAIISLVALFGMKAVAAFGIVMRLQLSILMPAFALGGAAATFMGQNLGACQPDRARKSVWIATWFDFAIMALVGLLFFNLARPIISVFNDDPDLLRMGSDFLKISSFFYVFIAFGLVLNRGLGGAGDTFVPMIITLLALWGYLVPMAHYLSKHTALGVQGIWWAVATSYAVNAVLAIIWFEMGRWRKRQPETCK
jgi:putative MATE family efflux protein